MSDTGAGSYVPATGVWSVGTIAAGSSATLRITATVQASGDYLNRAEVTASPAVDPDSTPGNGVTTEDDYAERGTTPKRGNPLLIEKEASKDQAVVGEVVTYSVAIKNKTEGDVLEVRLRDQIPPDFKYLKGTARLDGSPIADPEGNRPLLFDIGKVPALVDTNGNGVADPGERGYRLLVYQLVVGAGATPGMYENTAVAVAGCDTCTASNAASAEVEVTQDLVFDLGTIIGKVYEDRNADGEQQPDEPGVAGAMVVLDNGTYALTDPQGRYHFPALLAGHRMVKLNLLSLPAGTVVTTPGSVVVWLTPGLLGKANFGIAPFADETRLGQKGASGLDVAASGGAAPVVVQGNAETRDLLVNGDRVELPTSSVVMTFEQLEDVVELKGTGHRAAGPVHAAVGLRETRSPPGRCGSSIPRAGP